MVQNRQLLRLLENEPTAVRGPFESLTHRAGEGVQGAAVAAQRDGLDAGRNQLGVERRADRVMIRRRPHQIVADERDPPVRAGEGGVRRFGQRQAHERERKPAEDAEPSLMTSVHMCFI
jgi:hypothetical protein